MALNATPGSPVADSYATVAEGTAYFDAHLFSTGWDAAVSATREKALKTATRLLDSYFKWLGIRTNEDQSLGFPRTGLFRDTTIVVDSTTIPIEIRNAAIEFSQWLMANNPLAENDVAVQGITSIKVATIELKFKEVIESRSIPDFIKLMVPPEWYEGGILDDELDSSIFEVV
jgi:hypothetical protein